MFGVCSSFEFADQPLAIYSEGRISDDVACWQDNAGSENEQLELYWVSSTLDLEKELASFYCMGFDMKPENNGERVT